ncbi:amidase [Tateyamaria omphalii]|uniref:amidase family protein n=1 Tax=Tateyamaria omphalii TaxID=299262 RepID=UPI00167C1DBA|nr:amidase [Tateyamaria omphalii]GGX67827.1 amidase [Tateyamaria omphalii]
MTRTLPSATANDPTGAQLPELATLAPTLSDPGTRRDFYAWLTARRDRFEPTVNAFEARKEDCPHSVVGPLNGVPITVKDQIAVTGWPRSFGQEKRQITCDTTSATLIDQLCALGAVVTGKTALPPNAMDFQTFNARRGATCNPHNPDFTTGGSTGGGAAAVACGMSLLDIGADLGGSLRIPAGWCGVTSYTPTENHWPNDGLLPGKSKLDHFARIGLTARTAADIDYINRLLSSDTLAREPLSGSPKIALWSPHQNSPCDQDTLDMWQSLGSALQALPVSIVQTPMSALFDSEVYRLSGEIIGHETGALVPWIIRWLMRRDQRARKTSPGFVAYVHTGYKRDAKRYKGNVDALLSLRAEALKTWSDIDALLLPVTGVCAFRHINPVTDQNGVRTYDTEFETATGRLGYFDALTRFTLPLTALGWPVVTLPIGHDSNGMPVGAQLVGKPGQDARLLRVATAVQSWLN